MPLLARLVFAGVLANYFWTSAMTKLGDGPFGFLSPSIKAYAQIFPRRSEDLLYDPERFSHVSKAVIFIGTSAEFILPLFIIVGLFGRLAALGMVIFVVVQSLTDVIGHGADAKTIGGWFDSAPDAVILDQRAFWLFLLVFLALRGAGPVSIDQFLINRARAKSRRVSWSTGH